MPFLNKDTEYNKAANLLAKESARTRILEHFLQQLNVF